MLQIILIVFLCFGLNNILLVCESATVYSYSRSASLKGSIPYISMTLKRHSHTTVIIDRIKIALLFVVVCIVAISSFKMILTYIRAKRSIHDSIRAQEVLKEKEQKLATDIELTKTDFGQETLLREKYGFAKEGENVVFVIPESKSVQIGENTNTVVTPSTSLREKWKAFKDALFGK